jgi:hypothetical protein
MMFFELPKHLTIRGGGCTPISSKVIYFFPTYPCHQVLKTVIPDHSHMNKYLSMTNLVSIFTLAHTEVLGLKKDAGFCLLDVLELHIVDQIFSWESGSCVVNTQ